MNRLIDLTYKITDGMPVWPGDVEVVFNRTSVIPQNDYNNSKVCFGTHTGTHIDSPHHAMHDNRGVDRFDLDALVGWAEVLDFGELAPRAEIISADLDLFDSRVPEGARLLLKTGWGKRWSEPEFFTEFPSLSEGAAAWLAARKIKLLGIEQPSVHTSQGLHVHKALLSTGMVLLETVANMSQITADRVFLTALPLNLAGLDGAPTRVVAIEGEMDRF